MTIGLWHFSLHVSSVSNAMLWARANLRPHLQCSCSEWPTGNRKKLSQEPGTAEPDNMLGCCLNSFHFLWAILSTSTVDKFNTMYVPQTPVKANSCRVRVNDQNWRFESSKLGECERRSRANRSRGGGRRGEIFFPNSRHLVCLRIYLHFCWLLVRSKPLFEFRGLFCKIGFRLKPQISLY